MGIPRPRANVHQAPERSALLGANQRRANRLHSFAIIEGSDEGFFVLDQQWRLAYVNARAQEIWGRGKRELRGKVIWEVFPAAVSGDVLPQLRRAAQQRRWTQFMTRSLGNRWLELHVHPCHDYLCVYFRRVSATERNRAGRTRLLLRCQISAALEQERQHIARELHDGTGQLLTALAVGLRALEETRSVAEAKRLSARLRRITTRIFDEIGHLMLGLRSPVRRDGGFIRALQRLTSEFSKSHGMRVELAPDALRSLRLDSLTQASVYRIVQEALTNVGKHAGATRARITFQSRAGRLRANIRDNGRGFSVTALHRDGKSHLGLHTMRERAEMLGGKLSVHSAPGRGTWVQASIPVAAAQR